MVGTKNCQQNGEMGRILDKIQEILAARGLGVRMEERWDTMQIVHVCKAGPVFHDKKLFLYDRSKLGDMAGVVVSGEFLDCSIMG